MKLEPENENWWYFTEHCEKRKFCLFRLQRQECMADQTLWVTKIVNIFRQYHFYKCNAQYCLVVMLRLKLRIAEKFTAE